MSESVSCTMFVELNSQRFPLELGQIYLIGKQLSNAEADIKKCINLEDKDDVDQKHCVLEVGVGDDVYILDLFSSNGTYLNNERLKALEKTRLKNGDIFKVGLEQQLKYYHEQPEISLDSSGFLEVNKNTSDIVASSPEFTSQRESRIKRLDNNNFLVPAVPPQIHITPNTSLVITEAEEKNTSKILINSSTNSRRSDSFIIPETQFCKSRSSLNASELSIAESNPDVNVSKNTFNYLDDDNDDDFCIPETQEAMMVPISCSQRPRLLTDDKKSKEKCILEEKSVGLDDEDSLDSSEFRICTQEYNEGFGEVKEEFLTSQIIPIIKHNIPLLDNPNKSNKLTTNNESKLTQEEKDKEMSTLQWNDSNLDQENTNLRADCSTPDIFDIECLEQNTMKQPIAAPAVVTKDTVTIPTILVSDPAIFEDEEDLMPTQILPSNIAKSALRGIVLNEKPCLEKEQEEDTLTLSDKENRRPCDLEPIADLPPTQLLAVNEASSTNSFTFSRKSATSKSEEGLNLNPSTSNAAQNNKSLSLDLDEEDDRLTQAFLQPTKPLSSATANPLLPAKCMNSTLLDEQVVSNKNPATFFAEIEKTPLKQTKSTGNIFKMPERDFTSLRKTSSAASTNSESDLDLLMCTPQLIKEHMGVDQNDEFKKYLLAAKTKNLFGDDTDEEEDDRNKEKQLLVELINIPKDSKDFDKLLPHLKNSNEYRSKRNKITEDQKAAKEAYKDYKFNISFGHEQEANKSAEKSATLSRDERHAARDKEKELAKKNVELKKSENSKDEKMQKKQSTRKTKANKETKVEEKAKAKEKPQETAKQERPTRSRKRLQSSDKTEPKDNEKKSKETIKEINSTKEKDTKEVKDTKKDTDNSSVQREPKQMPARRMTRLKSKLIDEKHLTSKEALAKEKSHAYEEDDLDNIPTQLFAPSTRSRSNSKHNESQDSVTSNTKTTSHKTTSNKTLRNTNTRSRSNSKHSDSQDSVTSTTTTRKTAANKTNSTVSHNHSANDSVSKTNNERKRKAGTPTQQVTMERKRLRSTSSQDLSTIHSTTLSTSSSTVHSISMTMVQPELFQKLITQSAGLWTIAKNPAESDVLVMDKAYRTFKFLLAMARGIPIVTSEWLKKINETKSSKKAPINDYLFSDAEFEKKHKFSFAISLQKAGRKQRLFEDYEFLMTSGILPNPTEIKTIIEAAGGCVHLKNPPPARENQKIYLISSVNDKKDWHKFRRLNKNIIIISTEAIMSAVMEQSCLPLSNSRHILA